MIYEPDYGAMVKSAENTLNMIASKDGARLWLKNPNGESTEIQKGSSILYICIEEVKGD